MTSPRTSPPGRPEGEIRFHDRIGDSCVLILSHPRGFTPICTTESGIVARSVPEFEKRNAKVLDLSMDSAEDHGKWQRDIEAVAGCPANFPVGHDTSPAIARP